MINNPGIGEILRAVAIRWRLVSLLVLAFFSLFLVMLLLLQPKFESYALLEVLPARNSAPHSSSGFPIESEGLAVADDMVTIATESAKITSERTARAVYKLIGGEYADAIRRADGTSAVSRPFKSLLAAGSAVACGTPPNSPARISSGDAGTAGAIFRLEANDVAGHSPAAITRPVFERAATGATGGPPSSDRAGSALSSPAVSLCTYVARLANPEADGEALFQRFRQDVSAEAVRGTRLIQVSFTAPDADVAAHAANAFADEYLRQKAEEQISYRTQLATWLDNRLADLRGRVQAADRAVADYRTDTSLIEMGKETDQARRTPVTEELANALDRVASARVVQADAEAKLARLTRVRGNANAVASMPEVLGSPVVGELLKDEAAARRRLAELRASYGGKHPLITSVQADIDATAVKLNEEIGKIVAGAEQSYQDANATLQRLDAQVAQLQARAAGEQHQRVGLRELERSANAESELYDSYLRLAQQMVQQQSWNPANVTVVAAATPPIRPAFPDKHLMLPLGLVASVSLSVLFGTAAELRRQHRVFVDPRGLEQATGLPVVGAVPRVRRPTEVDATDDYPLAIGDLAMRLRGVSPPDERRPCVIGVMSATPGDGKSVLTVALARWFSACGERVLIIDGDIWRPSIRPLLRMPGEVNGHATVMRGADVDIASPQESIPTAPELLAEVSRLLEEARASYDVIMVDTPALLAVSDALTVANRCDKILFAVRWASTPKDSVRFALREFGPELRDRVRLAFSMVERRSYRAYAAPGSERYRYGVGKRHKALSKSPSRGAAKTPRLGTRRA